MHRLSPIILFLCGAFHLLAQSTHGELFKVDCASCHHTGGWGIDMDSIQYDHDSTDFLLVGTHIQVDCKSCHTSLIFNEAPKQCASCHNDIHSMSVGNDCAQCHNSNTWLVDDIPELHEANGFPLIGAHNNLSCVDCHLSETNLRFDRIGNDCINCHLEDYNSTTNPNHSAGGFSQNCIDCHSPLNTEWTSDQINHDFFPLTLGHDMQSCQQCHLTENYADASPDCINCHQADYNNAKDPDHLASNFSTECNLCHTTDPAWQPADFTSHDELYFPIYSGEHQGAWTACLDCHTAAGEYTTFSCITCHTSAETDEEHDGVSGYVYDDNACLACHPTGSSDMAFDHNLTQFPLTGAHIETACLDCHQEGYIGISPECINCHANDYELSVNPSHTENDFPTDCASCHSSDPDWKPASFNLHDEFYPLNGAHALIESECLKCHQEGYANTPNTCVGCHLTDYNNTTNPVHVRADFSNECMQCHSEASWSPAEFDHDQSFPIYSGAHLGQWADCIECHTDPDNFMEFSCLGCHANPETDAGHQGVNGYIYQDNACLICHPTGSAEDGFDHNLTSFPLTGAHVGAECIACHSEGYQGTSTDCMDCHTADFNAAINPNHQEINLSTDCNLCHTTDAGWMPASFTVHDDFYQLLGAHEDIANNCAECHTNGNYTNTPNTCAGCHQTDYDNTTNPDHTSANFSNNCIQCHTEGAWTPAIFDHNTIYPLNGAHADIANNCAECHINGDYTNTPNTCAGCHQTDYDNTTNPDHSSANFPNDCIQCHTEGAWTPASFDHNVFYPLNGAHADIANNCAECHTNGDYTNTPNTCAGCHQTDYDNTTNPDHASANFPNDCIQCHTEGAWTPANFDHNAIYPLNGAHADIANDCVQCHANGDYNNTPNTCAGCHQTDYDNTTNPDHASVNFPNDCIQCHTEGAWTPANFDHNAIYPLNGAHADIANDCVQCHANGDYNNTPNTCVGCHLSNYNNTNNPDHASANFPNDCIQCHTEGAWTPASFDHNAFYPLNGAHAAIANNCVECHVNGDYNNTPNTCVGCHLSDYNNTNNPNHSTAQFPTDCIDCHGEGAWTPATFDHDGMYFPIYSGKHQQEWNTCSECHTNAGDYSTFSCIDCHEHNNKNEVDKDHDEEAGYMYESNACLSCHPTGDE